MSHTTPRANDDSGLGILVLVVFAAFIWALVRTWPWPLLLPAAISLSALAVSRSFRDKVRASFEQGDVELKISAFRNGLSLGLFIMGAVLGAACAFTFGSAEMQWWLIFVVPLALAFQLRALTPIPGRWSRLGKALYGSAAELFLITCIVLCCYAIVLWPLQTVPLNRMTLDALRTWDRRVIETHEFLEVHKPGLYILLLVQAIIVVFRIGTSIYPSMDRQMSAVAQILVGGVKSVGRVSTALAIAASLTFLATQGRGPAERIGLTLRDAKSEYRMFQTDLAARANIALREALLVKAWAERPPLLINEMAQSAQFQTLKEDYIDASKRAKESFDVTPVSEPTFALFTEIPVGEAGPIGVGEVKPPSSWTPEGIHNAVTEVETATQPKLEEKLNALDGALEESAKNVFEKLLPVDKIFAQATVTKLLTTHYPVFEEFLDAVSSSISEASFDAIRSRIVQRTIEARAAERATDIAIVVDQQARAEVANIHLGWERFDTTWQRASQRQIEDYERQLLAARNELENDARGAQQRMIRDSLRLEGEKEKLMGSLDLIAESAPLMERESTVHALALMLATLSESWPPLKTPSEEQNKLLTLIYEGARDKLATAVGAPKGPRHFRVRWAGPLRGISSLELYCDDEIFRAVGNNINSESASWKLRGIMGDSYSVYRERWNTEVRRQQAVKEEEARREAERVRVREITEHDRPMEVP